MIPDHLKDQFQIPCHGMPDLSKSCPFHFSCPCAHFPTPAFSQVPHSHCAKLFTVPVVPALYHLFCLPLSLPSWSHLLFIHQVQLRHHSLQKAFGHPPGLGSVFLLCSLSILHLPVCALISLFTACLPPSLPSKDKNPQRPLYNENRVGPVFSQLHSGD